MTAEARIAALLQETVEQVAEFSGALTDDERAAVRCALVKVLESDKRPLEERLRAGRALDLFGDPRLDPLQPPMVLVPAGPFRLGMSPDQVKEVAEEFDLPVEWLHPATPQHSIELDEFEIGLFPVTNAEWARFLGATGHPARPSGWPGPTPGVGRGNHPVWGIPWEAVLDYCTWWSTRTGRRYRIPTEAEWEKAARGMDARSYPWGEGFDPTRANTRETGIGDTTPVGMFAFAASPYGILDMAGNVEEYTASLMHPYAAGHASVPRNEIVCRVTRGGCFSLDGDLARCDRRHAPEFGGCVGFRLARSRSCSAWTRRATQRDAR